MNVNVSGAVEPPGVTADTPTRPAAWAGVSKVRVVPFAVTSDAGISTTEPSAAVRVTEVTPETKPVPVSSTSSPPSVLPESGSIAVAVGRA